ncbi:MAG: BlaI/MecI/CopY family transcriptional regulator [Nitrososphaerales archaeon]|nr:BlaI/MecI/CopY family transcriptional regulator [Nitrososphaerales archaeon]
MKKRVKIELEDDEGTKFTLALEGKVSREKLLKAVDMLEIMDVPLDRGEKKAPDEGTFFGKVTALIETVFASGDFSSSDVAREFEERYNQPVKLSMISTYLSRLADKECLKRERFGNSWVYRRVYLKASQVAGR